MLKPVFIIRSSAIKILILFMPPKAKHCTKGNVTMFRYITMKFKPKTAPKPGGRPHRYQPQYAVP
jgi:hypothetical protein